MLNSKYFFYVIVFLFFVYSGINLFIYLNRSSESKSYREINGRDTILDIERLRNDLKQMVSTSSQTETVMSEIANDKSRSQDERVVAQKEVYDIIFNEKKQDLNDDIISKMVVFYAQNSIDRNLTDNLRSIMISDISRILIYEPKYYELVVEKLSAINPYPTYVQEYKTREDLITGLKQMTYDTFRNTENFDNLAFELLNRYENTRDPKIKKKQLENIQNMLRNTVTTDALKEKYSSTSQIKIDDLKVNDSTFVYHFLNLISFTENNIKDDSKEIETLYPLILNFSKQPDLNQWDQYRFNYCLAKYYVYKKNYSQAKIYITKMNNSSPAYLAFYIYFKDSTLLDSDKKRFQKIVPGFMH